MGFWGNFIKSHQNSGLSIRVTVTYSDWACEDRRVRLNCEGRWTGRRVRKRKR